MSAIPAPIAGTEPAHRHLPVGLVLGRVEGLKLLRHPATVIGMLMGFAVTVAALWHDVPVLNRFDALTQEALIPFACGVLIASQLGTMRARRYRTTELFQTVASSDASRTAAHLVAVGVATLFSLLLVVAHLAYMKAIGGVTSPRPVALLLGPALVAFAGSFGVAMGRWSPRLFSVPLGLAGLVAISTALSVNTFETGPAWLSLWVPSEIWSNVAGEVSLRPYGWRILYVLGLAAIAAALALAKHRRFRLIAIGLGVILLVCTAYAGNQQLMRPSRREQIALASRMIGSLKNHTCREYESVNYCAVAGYEDWIDRWRAPVEGVLASVPPGVPVRGVRVIQTLGENEVWGGMNGVLTRRLHRAVRNGELSSSGDITPPLSWGRTSETGKYELATSLKVAATVTGFDTDFRLTKDDVADMGRSARKSPKLGRRVGPCSGLEQGRSIVALWLAAQATDGTAIWLHKAQAEEPYTVELDPSGRTFFTPEQVALSSYAWETIGEPDVIWGTRDAAYARQLFERDATDVRRDVAAHWDRLTDPATTSDEAAGLLGLELLPPLDQALANWEESTGLKSIKQLGYPTCR